MPQFASHTLQGLRGARCRLSVISLAANALLALSLALLVFVQNPSQSAAVVSDFCRLKENPGAGESFLGRSKSQPNIKEIL